ncbi:MAG: zinc-dependent peptidase [Actinomycetota bacterium]|nr:zinc-dependent peptidase [Actinomycetota bacterium]
MPLFRRRRTAALPEGAVELLERRFAHWRRLDDEERERLLELMAWVLGNKRFEAARGFELDDTVRIVLAAQVALFLLGLTPDHLRLVTSIVVHPTSTTTIGERPGHIEGTFTDDVLDLDGLAEEAFGPVLVAWDAAADAARHPARGYDVVVHELAHKLDMLDGLIDGTPPLRGEALAHWVGTFTPVYDALVAGEDRFPLDPYGAEDPGECFAVAVEAFFCQPVELLEHEPELYEVLRESFGQDPAERQRRRPRPPARPQAT